MSWRVFIREPAQSDLCEIRAWYHNQGVGLDDEFLVAVAEALARLEK